MRRKWILVAIIAGVVGVLVVSAFRKEDPRSPRADWPVNFAHRGDSSRVPENTLESFRSAVESGAGGLELDVHMTRDGRIVVIHDDTLDRTTNGTGPVRKRSLMEIERLDAGYSFAEGGSYPYRGKGLRVPTLEDVFKEFPGLPVNVEIKEDQPGIEEAVLRAIREAGAEDRTLVASQRHAVIQRFRRVSGGEISTSASRREIRTFFLLSRLRLESLSRPAYDALQVPVSYRGIEIVTPRLVEAAHARGVRIDAWTVDSTGEMRRLLDKGVDVVMTNRPGRLQEVLEQRRKV